MAIGQRGWKRQPLGMRTASGASPLRISRRERSRGSRRGTTESSATVDATEEAVLNALFAAPDVKGREGRVERGLPHDEVLALLRERGAL